MNIEIHYHDFSDLCGTDLKRIHVRQDGVYLEEIPESVARFLSPEELETLSFKKAREAFNHTDRNKPILFFPMTMDQFQLFAELAGFSSCINDQDLKSFVADQEELNDNLERHTKAMTGDTIGDRIYKGAFIPTIEDRDLEEVIVQVSEILEELKGQVECPADNVHVGGHALCSNALYLLDGLKDAKCSESKQDFENSMAHLENMAIQLVFRIFEREAKESPHASEKVKKLVDLFRSGRRKGDLDDLGDKVLSLLREHVEAQEGDNRKFPTWREVVKALHSDSVRSGNANSPIYEVLWEDGNRSSNEGTIELLSKEKPVTFLSLRDRLTGYRQTLREEFQTKNISIS